MIKICESDSICHQPRLLKHVVLPFLLIVWEVTSNTQDRKSKILQVRCLQKWFSHVNLPFVNSGYGSGPNMDVFLVAFLEAQHWLRWSSPVVPVHLTKDRLALDITDKSKEICVGAWSKKGMSHQPCNSIRMLQGSNVIKPTWEKRKHNKQTQIANEINKN